MDDEIHIKPNFLIVGAAKSGTTSLYRYLKGHPDVFLPWYKEPSYFEPRAPGSISRQEYYRLFKDASDFKRVGEASVAYLYSETARELIFQELGPDVKIIILLRNPVDRAYSHWGHKYRMGVEKMSFEEALADEDKRLFDEAYQRRFDYWIAGMAYIQRGKYYAQVKGYMDAFGRNNVGVYIFEEFFGDSLPMYSSLCRFLGINDSYSPDSQIYNKAGMYRYKPIAELLCNESKFKDILKQYLPFRMRQVIRRLILKVNTVNKPMPSLTAETRNKLMDIYESDVKNLGDLICRSDLASIWGYE